MYTIAKYAPIRVKNKYLNYQEISLDEIRTVI